MPGQLDSSLRQAAERLIDAFGGTISYLRTTETFSADTGKITQSETAFTTVASPPEPFRQNRVDGTTIQVGDMKMLLKALNLPFTPTIGDKLIHAGVRWQVVAVMPIYSGELPAVYEVQLRQ